MNNISLKERIEQIRILPMTSSKDLESEFYNKTASEMQNSFFKAQLAVDGEYKIRRASKFSTYKNTLVLFQFNRQIIAAAFLQDYKEFNETEDAGYIGKYIFDKENIMVFNPISEVEFNNLTKDEPYRVFRNPTYIIPLSNLEAILSFIRERNFLVL